MFSRPLLGTLAFGSPPDDQEDLVSVHVDPTGSTVRLAGELDVSNARSVFAALRRRVDLTNDLVLDLQALEFIDCAGLHQVSELAYRLGQSRSRLILRSPRSIVVRALEITRISELSNLSIEQPGRRTGRTNPDRSDHPVRPG